jgi:hypothetical protein
MNAVPNFLACSAKLDAAKEAYSELVTEHNAYMDDEPLKFSSSFDEATGWWVFHGSAERISLRYSTLVGNCVHNLRSTLDHVVAQLVVASGNEVGRTNQFPVADTEGKYREQASRLLRGVSDELRAAVEACQPYNDPVPRADPAKPHPLVVLAKMSNLDKHQIINAVQLVCPPGTRVEFGSNADAGPIGDVVKRKSGNMANGDEFVRVHITPVGPAPEVFITHMTGEVVFVDSQAPVAETLIDCAQHTARALDRAEAAVKAL